MFVLRSIEIDGFGPFVGRQSMKFPEHGVTVVHGENMRGKTSLLNAIRYALFGRVLGRGVRERRLHTISNRDSAARGQFGFSVTLAFTFDGEPFELLRACRPRRDCPVPAQDADYDQVVVLRHGPDPLGPHERDAVLARVLPEQVSRFFLFDGELLQEYEELLYDESTAGRAISAAIERILGVPLLTRGQAHLTLLSEEASKAAGFEASKSRETEVLGTALGQAVEQKDAHKAEVERLRRELRDLGDRRKEVEGYLQSIERYSNVLRDRDACDTQLLKIKGELEQTDRLLKEAMRHAWRTVLGEPIRAARAEAVQEAKREINRLVTDLRREAIDDGHCGTCDRPVDPPTAARLRATLEGEVASSEIGAAPAFARLAALEAFGQRDVADTARQLHAQRESLRADQALQRDLRTDLMTELGDADVERMRNSSASLGDVMKKIAVVETAIEKESDEIAKLEKSIERFNDKLQKLGGHGSAKLREAQAKSKLLGGASQVFTAAIERYKAELRGKVQATATDLFLKMSTEKEEYSGLEINSNYGLQILHKGGGAEDGRSAGAEHVIALALMGALQRNAPFRGPIVMDSPFGRLDPGHTTNVLMMLPDLAPQVVLLLHRGEASRESVRSLLGTRLLAEFELVKLSARRTEIRPVT